MMAVCGSVWCYFMSWYVTSIGNLGSMDWTDGFGWIEEEKG